MQGYDPSLKALLRKKIACAFHNARQLLPLWSCSAEPRDPDTVLDAREIEILRLYGMSRTPQEIAFRLFISIQAAETHLTIISRKLRVRRRHLQKVAIEYSRGVQIAGNGA